jgi:TPP-dependent pyruvate/acetoin dehydrogenase alpha subunit
MSSYYNCFALIEVDFMTAEEIKANEKHICKEVQKEVLKTKEPPRPGLEENVKAH